MFVGVLSPIPYGTQGVVVERLRQQFQEHPEVTCLFYYAFDFTLPAMEKALIEVLAEKPDILVTVGRQYTIFVENYLKENSQHLVPYRIAIGISKPFDSTATSTSIAYTYAQHTAYAPLLMKCVPHLTRVFAPTATFNTPYAKWEEEVIGRVRTSFVEQNIDFWFVSAESSLALQKEMLSVPKDYQAIIAIEGGGTTYVHGLCAHLAKTKKIPFFSGNLSDVQAGSAAIGYGANFELHADAATELIHRLVNNTVDRTTPIPPRWVDLPRTFAVNLVAAEDQGLDLPLIKTICHEQKGLLYYESKPPKGAYS